MVGQTIATRIQKLLEVDISTGDSVDEPWLAELYIDGVGNKIRTGPRSGQKTSMAYGPEGPAMDREGPASGIQCANYQGFSVHATWRFGPQTARVWNRCANMLLGRRWLTNGFRRHPQENLSIG